MAVESLREEDCSSKSSSDVEIVGCHIQPVFGQICNTLPLTACEELGICLVFLGQDFILLHETS